ncbi:MAG: hypothetical protein NVS2B16_36990 [Chloroflexota bacterium]
MIVRQTVTRHVMAAPYRLHFARDEHCICSICPHCQTDKKVGWKWTAPGPLRTFWWTGHYCWTCGSRWASWHALEMHTGLTWRRLYAVNPGAFTAMQVAEMVAMRRAYRRDGGHT